MARDNNDLLTDGDLDIFLEDSEDILGGDPNVGTVSTSPAESNEWEDEADDLPGQLAVDVFETNEKLVVKARTAGIGGRDLDVNVADNILTISGTLHGSDEEDVKEWHIQECYWGEFSRTIALPVPVKEEGVQASLKNGILTITFDKVQLPGPTRVTVEDQ